MKTDETVTDLGLYSSECCGGEGIFDTGDRFLNCPQCGGFCLWELKEEIVPQDELWTIGGMAA